VDRVWEREPLLGGGGSLRDIGLVVLTSLDQMHFILKILFHFITKRYLNEEASLPLHLVFPGLVIIAFNKLC
jgi:hypothetical protein